MPCIFIQPRERSERGCTKSYRGLVTHFWLLNDHFLIARRSSLEILVFSPRSKFGGAKRVARTGREDGQKKILNFFSPIFSAKKPKNYQKMIIYHLKVGDKSPVRFSTTPLASLAGLNKQVKMPKMTFYILWKNETDLHMIVGSIYLIFKLGKIGKKLP